jgi:hypothetical protein
MFVGSCLSLTVQAPTSDLGAGLDARGQIGRTATTPPGSRQLQHPAQVDDFVAVYTLIRPGERLSPSRRSARQTPAIRTIPSSLKLSRALRRR